MHDLAADSISFLLMDVNRCGMRSERSQQFGGRIVADRQLKVKSSIQ
jgi:hypothetical protein